MDKDNPLQAHCMKTGKTEKPPGRNIGIRKADDERQAAGLPDLLARLATEQKERSNGVDQQYPALAAFAKYQNIEKLTREILIEPPNHCTTGAGWPP